MLYVDFTTFIIVIEFIVKSSITAKEIYLNCLCYETVLKNMRFRFYNYLFTAANHIFKIVFYYIYYNYTIFKYLKVS
jgi:hypothetical protein